MTNSKVIFQIDFLKEPAKNHQLESKRCVRSNDLFSTYQQLSSNTLSLSIGNVWSGCHIDVVEGEASYFCEGGRSFSESGWFIFTIKACAPVMDTYLNYTIEILAPKENCTFHSRIMSSGASVLELGYVTLFSMFAATVNLEMFAAN